ncbi:MAG: hypothetical protein ABIH77_02640 [Pseudomonadota bacterium]|nr:hypothetical protein [Gammaproteobacteria bacterium]MBU1628637.1 hypothetical protein [Gammaproteobacteria bacterium]MBU1926721.1 hypothetical protein [Gammaproteobacteria bacterium]MBU2546574.1 hypothetical protein [Gammaproteobacteria bacterium]
MKRRNYWPTEEKDLQMAAKIIEKHIILNNGEPLSFVDIVMFKEFEQVDFDVPEWILELTEFFSDQYGLKKGQDITKRVLAKYMLQGQTVH